MRRFYKVRSLDQWYEGFKQKEVFNQPADSAVEQVASALGVSANDIEVVETADAVDPRSGALLQGPQGPVQDPDEAPLSPAERKQLRALLRARTP